MDQSFGNAYQPAGIVTRLKDRMLLPLESSTQTRTFASSASLIGSPFGTSITRVAHPLFMTADTIQQPVTQAWIAFAIFTGFVLSQDVFQELEDR